MVLVTILGGLINSAVMLLCVLFWDWRIGLLALAGMALYLLLLSRMEKQSAKIAPKRQRDEARLVEAVLEQLQGMSVIKSFNLTGKGDKRIRQALEDSREQQSGGGKAVHPLHLGPGDGPPPVQRGDFGSRRVAVSERKPDSGQRPDGGDHLLPDLLPDPVRRQRRVRPAAGGQLHRPRQPGGRDPGDGPGDGAELSPGKPTTSCSTMWNFSYGSRPILKDVPSPSRTGPPPPSWALRLRQDHPLQPDRPVLGCGRRPESPSAAGCAGVHAGSLMDQVSMVFQRVYLFHDTIENNIKFGCPNATQPGGGGGKESLLPRLHLRPAGGVRHGDRRGRGYPSPVVRNSGSPSPGAMLKDAPSSSSTRPPPTWTRRTRTSCKKAMEALTREKTVLMIAHRLKTVRSADQILVLIRPASPSGHPPGGESPRGDPPETFYLKGPRPAGGRGIFIY